MKNREQIEIEIDSFLKIFQTAALQIHDYKKRANNIIELLEDYLCIFKEAILNIERPPEYTFPVNVDIRYDISKMGDTPLKNVELGIVQKVVQKMF